MSELLGLQQKPSQGVETEVARKAMPNASGMHPKLLKADFHGSLMTGIDLWIPYLLIAHLNFKSSHSEQKPGSYRSLRNCYPWDWEHLQGRDQSRPAQRYAISHPRLPTGRAHRPLVLPKQNSVFMFAVPLYSLLPASHDINAPLPIPASVTDMDVKSTMANLQTVLDVPNIQFQLYGNQFRFRSAERAGRKFKHKETIELWIYSSTWHQSG